MNQRGQKYQMNQICGMYLRFLTGLMILMNKICLSAFPQAR
jgi:hypothetical protein